MTFALQTLLFVRDPWIGGTNTETNAVCLSTLVMQLQSAALPRLWMQFLQQPQRVRRGLWHGAITSLSMKCEP